MKAAILTFPGSNCDRDLALAFEAAGAEVVRVWHKEIALPEGVDIVGVPGGFSFGDYLRCGAIAARAPNCRRCTYPCPKGWLCFRDLQWLSGFNRNGTFARSVNAQCGA